MKPPIETGMNPQELLAVATAISVLFFFVFKFLLSKIQSELKDFKTYLSVFQKEITDKIALLDKSLAVKANIIDYLLKEIEIIKKKIDSCKHCRGVDHD